jgi:hypothetical protein
VRRRTLAAVVTAAALTSLAIGAGTGSAESGKAAQQGVNGQFSLIIMTHTTNSSFGNLPGVNPWNGARRRGERFVYRSIPCSGMAPVNNISSDLPSYGGRVEGSRVPSSVRAHPMAFTLRKREGRWQMKGRFRFTVCKLGSGPTPADDPVPDAQKPKFNVTFVASFRRISAEVLRFAGSLRLRGGTGRYEDLTGAGQIAGYLFCFAPEGCTPNGRYLDAQMVMHGNYRDPTPQLSD